MGYSPWGLKESDTTERLMHYSPGTSLVPLGGHMASKQQLVMLNCHRELLWSPVQKCWEARAKCVRTEVPGGVRWQEEKGEEHQESPCV